MEPLSPRTQFDISSKTFKMGAAKFPQYNRFYY
jgi:hypothetical protein